ncbi:KR domain [Rhizoctonia solani]|uniref:KR domain n=1 Tax=Rhizoctonia solani TaxID=456999 RepID=A0A8H7ILP0_9AGAM|nr:KR domain [Rhizoctonia solani]
MSTESTPATAKTPSAPSFQLFSLVGQTAIVTGGTRGIGAACAIALAEAGADICLIQRDESNTTTRDAIRALGRRADIAVCDLSDLEAVKTVFDRALELMGSDPHHALDIELQKLDGLGGSVLGSRPCRTWETQLSIQVINVNLKAVWLLSQAAGRHMVPKGRGKIINFGSLMCYQGGITVPAYAAAKGGLGQLTKALSNEWSKHNVQVNAICPGYIATDMNEKLLADPNRLRQISERIPAGRWGEPKDFAGPTVFLASSASLYVSGELLVVDGGWMGR